MLRWRSALNAKIRDYASATAALQMKFLFFFFQCEYEKFFFGQGAYATNNTRLRIVYNNKTTSHWERNNETRFIIHAYMFEFNNGSRRNGSRVWGMARCDLVLGIERRMSCDFGIRTRHLNGWRMQLHRVQLNVAEKEKCLPKMPRSGRSQARNADGRTNEIEGWTLCI